MMHTSKMVLVPHELVQQNEDPADKILSNLDENMQHILNDRTIPSDKKLILYNQVLQRFKRIKQERDKPFKLEIQEPKIMTDEDILSGMPVKNLKQAASLLSFVKKNPHIQWTDDNELIVDGMTFPGTHIVDLIHDFSRERVTHEPVDGAEAFAKALKKGNVPRAVVGNKYRHKLMKDQPLVFATPPSGDLQPRSPAPLNPRKSVAKRLAEADHLRQEMVWDE
jgi:hypothetical protein